MKKRIICLLLTAIMVMGALPVFAMAEEACTHANTMVAYEDNKDGTHTKVACCEDCGEALEQDEIKLDFKGFAKEAAQQEFWDDLPTFYTPAGYEVKRIGGGYGYTYTDAENDMIAWMASRGWKFDTGNADNRMFLCAEDDIYWGIGHYAYFPGMENRSDLRLDITVAEAGTYQLTMDLIRSAVGCDDYPDDGLTGSGGGYGDIYVNGRLVCQGYDFADRDETDGLGQVLTADFGEVELNAGVNIVAIRTTLNYNGEDSNAGRNGQNVRALSLKKVAAIEDCVDDNDDGICEKCSGNFGICRHEKKTAQGTGITEGNLHSVIYVCDACGEEVKQQLTFDTKAFAKEAAKQDFWAELPTFYTADGYEVKRLGGGYGYAFTEAELAFKDWMADKDWNFDMTHEDNRIFLCAEDDVEWGVAHFSYFYDWGVEKRCDLWLNVFVHEAGEYNLTMDLILSAHDSENYPVDGVSFPGGSYADIYVNGERIFDGFDFGDRDPSDGNSSSVTADFDNVELTAGINTVVIRTTANYNGVGDAGGASGGRNAQNFKNITLTKTTDWVACGEDFNDDGMCDICGASVEDEPEVPEIEKFDLAGANMTLGNDLKMNFLIKKEDFKDGYVAKVTQTGREPVELELWSYNDNYYAASYSVAAKEMTDVLSCEIYDAEGNLVTNPFTRTVAQYALTLLNNASQKASLKSVIVDMLNYGTEAQKYFHYNEDAYANADVTEAQQTEFATKDVTCVNNQIKGDKFAGANLSLEDSILLNVFFFATSTDGLTAKVSFTDYLGVAVEADAEVTQYNTSMVKVIINQVVLADAKRPVTVTLYKDGNEIGSGVESVESYIARNISNASTGAINMAIMKFATSAYNYLGGTN